ncbi:MAG: hypothetical protein IJ125_00755 [Atopobiaceae bacterium]|nr:hypothetical protein [Atopobiaceae bacterium]
MNALNNAITNILIYEDAIERDPAFRITKPKIGYIELSERVKEMSDKDLLAYGKKCVEYNTFGADIDDIRDTMFPEILNMSVIVCNVRPAVYKDVIPDSLPITCTQKHLFQIMASGHARNRDIHGIKPELLKRIPELLEKPVSVAVDSENKGCLLVTLAASNNVGDSQSFTVSIKASGLSSYEMLILDSSQH